MPSCSSTVSGHFTRPLTSTDPPISSQKLWAGTEARAHCHPGSFAKVSWGHHPPPCTGVCNLALPGLTAQSEARASGLKARPLGCRSHILSIVPYRQGRDGDLRLIVQVRQVFQEPLVLTCDVAFDLQAMATSSQVLRLSSPQSLLRVPGTVSGAGETRDEDSSVLGARGLVEGQEQRGHVRPAF